MDNPFKVLREKHGLNKSELAEASYVDVRAIARIEDGLYTNPLPSLVDYWAKRGVNRLQLEEDYDDYIDAQRSRNKRVLGEDLITSPVGIHPFRVLRAAAGLHLTECAKALCVPVDTLQFFEKKWRLQQSVPKPIKAALNQIGYSFSEIEAFEKHYKTWRLRALADKVVFT